MCSRGIGYLGQTFTTRHNTKNQFAPNPDPKQDAEPTQSTSITQEAISTVPILETVSVSAKVTPEPDENTSSDVVLNTGTLSDNPSTSYSVTALTGENKPPKWY